MEGEKAVDAHLSEYQALRAESDHYAQRIDRVVGLYLAALFAVGGYILRPDSGFDLSQYLAEVQASPGKMSLYVFISILNSALIIRMVSFFAGVLAITQYTHFFIGDRITALVGEEVLKWDGPPAFTAKVIWIPLRLAGQTVFFVIAEFLTIFILVKTCGLLGKGWLIGAFYISGWIFLAASLAAVIAVFVAGALYHKPHALPWTPADSKRSPPNSERA